MWHKSFQSQEMLQVADRLKDASGVDHLQQMGDELISLARQSHKAKENKVKTSIEELKQKHLEAERRVSCVFILTSIGIIAVEWN